MSKQENSFKRKLTHMKSGGGHFDISVIVPVYNTARYLPECIDSILAQTKKKLQIILVDDGSTDDSAKICKKYAKRHRNIAYVYKENTGVAATRNLGARLASGDYITFVDSDDVIDPFMYERLYNLAQHFNCEVTTCGMAHFNNRTPRKYPSPLFDNAFKGSKIKCGNLADIPQQIFNTSCCNKLILRSYLEENEIKFPEGMVYEDLPFAIEILAKANSIASTPEKMYFYRVRTEDESSITQQRHDIANLQDRLKASRMVLKLLQSCMPASVVKTYQARAIEHDLKLAFRSIPDTLQECRGQALNEIASFVDECIDEDVLGTRSTLARLKIALAKDGDVEPLIKVINYEEDEHKKAPIHKEGAKLFTEIPKAFDERILSKINSDKLDVTREVFFKEPLTRVEHFDVDCDGGSLVVFGNLYQRYVPASSEERKYKAFLVDEFGEEFASLEVETVEPHRILQSHKVMRNMYDQSIIDYSGCGFKIVIPFSDVVAACGSDKDKDLLVRIDYEDSIMSGSFYLSKPIEPVEVVAKETCGIDIAQSGWFRINAQITTQEKAKAHSKKHIEKWHEKTTPSVSIVVPIHGEDSDLPAALDALAAQTLSNIQVILVDDKTSWNGSKVAQIYADKYDNFGYHQKEQGTLGDACNFGAELATGEYIAFASPYDFMANNAYECMYKCAKQNYAMLVAGDIAHYFDDGCVKQCDLARKTYGDARVGMDVEDNLQLMRATIPWNYIFHRAFYEKQNLHWDKDSGFEDGRLVLEALHFAKKLSYVNEVVFYWRKRNRNFIAPARQEDQAGAFIAKISALKQEDELLKKLDATQEEIAFCAFKHLDQNLRSDILYIATASSSKQQEAAQAIKEYIQSAPEESFKMLRCIERMKYHFAAAGDFNKVIELREYELSEYKVLEVLKDEQGRFIGKFPFDLNKDFFNMTGELPSTGLSTNIGEVKFNKWGLFKIFGQVFPYRIAVPDKSEISLSAKLKGIDIDSEVPLDIELRKTKTPTRNLVATNSGNKIVLEQPWRTYCLSIPASKLGTLEPGQYRIYASYAIDGLSFDEVRLGKPRANTNIQPVSYYVKDAKRKIDVSLGLSDEVIISVS